MESVLERMEREGTEKKIAVTDPQTGEQYGWGKVLDYIGVGWENKPDTDYVGQFSFDDYGDEVYQKPEG